MRRPVDETALSRAVARVTAADAPPWLHQEVARRMAERLGIIKLQPGRVLDWHAHVGGGRALLRQTYPRAEVTAVEAGRVAPRRDRAEGPWWRAVWPARTAPEPLTPEEAEAGAAQLVWANMMLHGAADPISVMRRWHHALAVEGFVMFSTLGPGSLPELRALYARQAWGPPMAPLVDMHDIGDMLLEAGFADPVMDQELITLTWPDAAGALAELRGLGANAALVRPAGLRTPAWRQRLLDAVDAATADRADKRVAFTFEVAYGHAFKPLPRSPLQPETRLPLADMRAMVRGSGGRR